MKHLITEIKDCKICLPHLTDGVNPVFAVHPESKIAIVGQAPGKIVHRTGIPWDDQSGERLRQWLGVDKTSFYDTKKFALIPMGFCYPGKGKSGDLPPRPECAPQWHPLLFDKLNQLQLVILIGQYAQKYYLDKRIQASLTATVRNYDAYLPEYFPLPHPSPRNNIWLKKNPWFGESVIPALKQRVRNIC